MPELPDILVYVDALTPRVVGQPLRYIRLVSPFVVRSVDPPISTAEGKQVHDVRRLGKRIVLCLEGDLFLIFHLMIAGRLRWAARGARPPRKIGLAAFDFPLGTLLMTEASPKKRASLYLVHGVGPLASHDAGGIDVLETALPAFRAVLQRETHTLKRALTDPRLFSGIGNAYSDEILHAAGLSPVQRTNTLTDEEIKRLWAATQQTLRHWIAHLQEYFGDRFPDAGEITAFRADFAVHGRYRQPCRACGTLIQRIRYADNETNYCPRCQTGGRLLADRALSRLLKSDWPGSLDELELRQASQRTQGTSPERNLDE